MTISASRTTKPSSRIRVFALFLLRVLIGGGALWWLMTKVDFDELRTVAVYAWAHPGYWMGALLVAFCGLCCGCVRWFVILQRLRFSISFGVVFRTFFIGLFFNAFMPGGCGGDFVRAYYIAGRCEKRRTTAVASVFLDRAIGLAVTLLVALGMTLLYTSFLWNSGRGGHLILYTITGLAGAGIASFIVLCFIPGFFLRWTPLNHGLYQMVLQICDTLNSIRNDPRGIALYVFLSLANLLFLTGSCYLFGISLRMDATFIAYLRFFPVITVLTAIPITPGGIGIREALFANLFRRVGISIATATTLSLFVYVGGLLLSLLGGLLYLFKPFDRRTPFDTSHRTAMKGQSSS